MRRKSMLAGAAIFLVAVLIGAAASLVNGPDGSSPVSAAQACDLMDTPYDTLITASAPGQERRIEIRDSGPDRQIVLQISNGEPPAARRLHVQRA